MSEDEYWRERLNRLEREQGYAPGGVLPADRLAYVTSRPASQKRFYRANPAAVLGPEVEGGVPVFDRDTSTEMLVYPVAKNPVVGDRVVVSEVPYRRVSEGAGPSIANPRTWCLTYFDCRGPLAGGCVLPGLHVDVTGPNGQAYSGVTDATGRVCFTVDGNGSYTAVTAPFGHWQGNTRTVNITFASTETTVLVQPVSGRVCSICNGACPPYPMLATLSFTMTGGVTVLNEEGEFVFVPQTASGTMTWSPSFYSGGADWPDFPGSGMTLNLSAGGNVLTYRVYRSLIFDPLTYTTTLDSITCDPYAASFHGTGTTFSISE